MAANILIDIAGQLSLRSPEISKKEIELREVRRRYFTAKTPRTKARYRNQDAQLRSEISELLRKLGLSGVEAREIASWDLYDQNAKSDWFNPEWMFGIKEGFDVVIENPPYISHDRIPWELKTHIKDKYQSYQAFADVYCYFIEKAVKLQNKGGILSVITSNSYLKAEYGAPIRRFLRNNNRLLRVLSIEDSQVFESVIVNVAILVSCKPTDFTDDSCIVVNSPFSDGSFTSFVKARGFNCLPAYFDSKSWNLAKPELVEIQKKIELSGKTLEQLRTKIRLGIATGSNEAFLIDANKKHYLCEKDAVNAEIIKPILRGRDISRYRYTLAEEYILLAKNGVNVKDDFPEIYKHLESFGDEFKNRGAQGQHWTNLRACSFYDDFKKEKIVWIPLSDIGRFALCREEVYLLNSAYFLLPPSGLDARFLLGVLNSNTIRFYMDLVALTSGMGVSQWTNNSVKELPIPTAFREEQAPIIQLVDQISAAKGAKPHANTITLEKEIDRIVYSLYDLTREEIAVVEENTV